MPDLDSLGSAGRRLYDSLHDDADPYSLTAMIVEAARIKDRLDQFDRVLSGDADAWLTLLDARGDDDILEIRVDNALQESRQQANTLRQLLGAIRLQKDAAPAGDDDDGLTGL
ncbi:hypothetical protein GS876_10390 [Rhodococcus hoagii]|nr:hypothetical protein [Prescottella equi]NKT31592.1 hypothetical protein [Prescottella equi]NKT39256.1 hypothetical protein [Prescottella equi]NKT72922.1 hypothetical protein [Prescottella equi]NKT75884.1 hypothetical protein [Prescottella equi]